MPATVYLNGEFLPEGEAKISPRDRGFLFSDGVYEALCSYDGRLFLAEEHFARLQRSLRELRIDADLTAGRFAEIARELVRRNDLEDRNAKVYLQVTRGAPPVRRHAFPKEPTAPTVYATAARYELPEGKWTDGIKVLLCCDERWGRCDIKSVSLLPNVLANQRAMEAGAFEALLVREKEDAPNVVTEGSHSSFAAVVDGTVVTHPLGPGVLPGVTRGLVLRPARAKGLPVREEPLPARDLPGADELFLIGTTTGVMPVTRVENGTDLPEPRAGAWDVGRPGPVTRQLQQAFRTAIAAPESAELETKAAFLGQAA
jgi:D-alanine transaminase